MMSNVIPFPRLGHVVSVPVPPPAVIDHTPGATYVDEFEEKHLHDLTHAVQSVTEAKSDDILRELLRDIRAQSARWDID